MIAAGFKEIKERESWKIERKGKYFFTRNGSAAEAAEAEAAAMSEEKVKVLYYMMERAKVTALTN